MPESMFGRPLQHLLPSRPQTATAGGSSVASDPHSAPVQSAPLNFKDFRFKSIGKQPELLSRISLSQPDHSSYHSPTPSPTPTPSPAFDVTLQSRSSSRPTLFQQLAGSASTITDGALGWHPSTSQSSGSLASRIQMDGTLSNGIVNAAHGTSPPSSAQGVRSTVENVSLIPPVEVLPQPPESSPPAPTSSMALVPKSMDAHSPASSVQLTNMIALRASAIPTPPASTTDATFMKPTQPSPSFAVIDLMMQDLRPSPSVAAIVDSLEARKERLQAISANLVNLSPLPLPSCRPSSPGPPSATPANENLNVTANQSSQAEYSSTPSIPLHPYSAHELPGRLGLGVNDIPMGSNDASLALVPSSTHFMQEYQTRRIALIEAVQALSSALDVFQHAQMDSENTLALQVRALEEERAGFEQTKRSEEAALRHESQKLQQKREELNAKEVSLASLEKESKAREVARKAMLAKRQAQEEEKRVDEAKRMQEVQEQIAAAMIELKEVETLRTKGQLGQLASETAPDDLPIEPQEPMDEEEIAAIKSHNDLLCAVKHLRRMYTDEVQKLEDSYRTLRRLEEKRKQREADETERRRIAEERLRARAEAERACQLLDGEQHDAERKRQEAENDRVQARLSVEQRAHAEARAHGPRRTGTASGQISEHPSHPEEGSATQQQSMTQMARIRLASDTNIHSSEPTNAMNVDEDGSTSAAHRAIPSTEVYTSAGGSQDVTSQSKQMKGVPISGGIMLAVSTPQASGVHSPAKPSATLPTLSSRDNAAGKLKTAQMSSASIPAEKGHEPCFPTQFAAEFNRAISADIRHTPDQRAAFSRTPKLKTVLDATNRGNQELNIGPVSHVSPTQRNVNLRHLKRSRGRVEENDNGDRSARMSNVKLEENSSFVLKREQHDDQFHELSQPTPSISIPPRPTIIPPPRPRLRRKSHVPPTSRTDASSSYQPESLSTTEEVTVATDERPREAFSRNTASFQAMDASNQLPVIVNATNSLLLDPEPQPSESHINAGERPAPQDRAENYDTSEPASITLSHELDGEDPPRSDRRNTDEHRKARKKNKARHPASPTQSRRLIDTWRPNLSNEPRAEPMHAIPTSLGRKRPSEFNDSEHVRRARRQRSDVWIASDYDRERVGSYRSIWDGGLDTQPDEHYAAYRAPETSRTTHDNRTYVSPSFEEPVTRWEPSYRRPENDNIYQRYQPSVASYSAMADQHYMDDVRVGQANEPTTRERNDAQDPSLLARMSNTQHFPSSANLRGRGKGEPNKGKGDSVRGRGRDAARGGLFERLQIPGSLEERLSSKQDR